MTATSIALLLFLPPQQPVLDYQFKHVKVARVVATRWRDLQIFFPGLQLAKSVQGEPTGTWVFVDVARNRVVIGSRDETGAEVLKALKEVDVAPIPVRLTALIARPDEGLELRSTLDSHGGRTCYFGAEDVGATLTITSRLRADGLVTVIVGLKVGDEGATAIATVKPTTRIDFSRGKAALVPLKNLEARERIVNPPVGDIWKPYVIQLQAEPRFGQIKSLGDSNLCPNHGIMQALRFDSLRDSPLKSPSASSIDTESLPSEPEH